MLSSFLGKKKEKADLAELKKKERELYRYIEEFKTLDNNVNQFFENYQSLPRTSGVMAIIWEAVMKVRTQEINALCHMKDEERFMHSPYKGMRIQEMEQHIIPLRQGVSRAVGVLTLFTKNLNDKAHDPVEWFFAKASFLMTLSNSIAGYLEELVENWKEFLLRLYEVDEVTKTAYNIHLEEKSKAGKLSLESLEAERCEKHFKKYETTYKKNWADKGTREQLKFLVMIEDVFSLIKATHTGHPYRKLAEEIREACGLAKNYTRRESFLTLKDFQLGVTDLGPFGLSVCKNPTKYLRGTTEPGEYPNGDKHNGYIEVVHKQTQKEFTDVFKFVWYKCNISVPAPITVTSHIKNVLGIPEGATQYAWVFPNIDDTKVADVEDEEQLENIREYKKRTDAIACIMATGGFAYFDKNNNFLNANGIFLHGDDMFFDGPFGFPDHKLEEYCMNVDEGENKMYDVTVPYLRNVFGCDKFGWISSDEELGITNGAFYYIYQEDKAPNYFKFLDFEQAALKKLKNNNTPGIQYLEMLWDRFKDDWGNEDRIEEFGEQMLSRFDVSSFVKG